MGNESGMMSALNGARTKSSNLLWNLIGFLLLLAALPDTSLGERADHFSLSSSTSEVFNLLPLLIAPTVPTKPVLVSSESAVAEPSSPVANIWAVACAIGKTSFASAAMIVAAPSLVVAAEGAGKFIEDSVKLVSTLCSQFGKCIVRFCTTLAEHFARSLRSNLLFAACVEEADEGLVLKPNVQILFFCLASTDAIHAIITNRPSRYERYPPGSVDSLVAAAKEQVTVRFFSPRALFVSGSFARAVQLCTNVQFAFDPSIGVCALANCGATWIQARWFPRIVVGWTASERIWRLCGAKPPEPRIGNCVSAPLNGDDDS